MTTTVFQTRQEILDQAEKAIPPNSVIRTDRRLCAVSGYVPLNITVHGNSRGELFEVLYGQIGLDGNVISQESMRSTVDQMRTLKSRALSVVTVASALPPPLRDLMKAPLRNGYVRAEMQDALRALASRELVDMDDHIVGDGPKPLGARATSLGIEVGTLVRGNFC